MRQEAAQSPEAFTEVYRAQEPVNGHLPNGAAPAAPPERGEKLTGTLHHPALRRCSAAHRPSLLSAHMRASGMNRCTMELSLTLQGSVESFTRVLSHRFCRLP